MDDDTAKTREDYHRVLATANKLETIQSNLESVIDFFLVPIVKLYTKLCNDCMKLLFESEFKLDHFRKAEELVWRRIYHDIYRFQKTKRQRVKRHDESLMESHFISGIGFYSSLIVKLRTHYKIYDIKGVIEPLSLTLGPVDNFFVNQRLNEGDEHDDDGIANEDNSMSIEKVHDPNYGIAREWARQAIYRSLVYMGDLARYLLETSQFNYRKLAFEFYRSASRSQPDHGLPFNQLATLAGGLNYNLSAVCNYMRCCLRPKPFEGAEGNMRKIFDLNRKFYEEISSDEQVCKISDVLASKEPSLAAESMIRTIIITFIKLTSDLWTTVTGGDSDQLLKEEIVKVTRQFFETLREALELEPIVPLSISSNFELEFCPISGGTNSAEKPKYVSPTIMYEFASVSIMLIAKCQKKQSSVGPSATELVSDYIVDLVNTLALNLLHYSTSKCQKMILGKVQEIRISNQEQHVLFDKRLSIRPLSTDINFKNSACNLSNSQRSSETINSLSEATSRRAMSRLRQRKAATKYSDSNNRLKPLVLHTEDSDMSELEETALSTIDALEISSDMSEGAEYPNNDLIDLDSSNSDETSSLSQARDRPPSNISSFNNLSKPLLRPTRSQNYELERSMNLANSSNSLPVPDLLTGDIIERANIKVSATSQNPLESPSGLDLQDRVLDKDTPQSNEANDLVSALTFVYTQTYLPTIKIFCDWLLSNGEIISSNLPSFHNFCKELDDLVSLLKDLRKLADTKDTNSLSSVINLDTSLDMNTSDESLVFKHAFDGPTWVQKYPLSCDFPLLNLDPLRSVHEQNIDFNHCRELGDSEAGFVTVQCIEAFFHALTAFLENKSI